MPNQPSVPLTFYKAWCFGLSPTYNIWAKLTAAEVHALKEREGFEGQNPSIYFHLNHPIRWIRLVGMIVALDVYENRYIMILDDSSGENIEVTCGREKAQATASEPGSEQMELVKTINETGKTASGYTVDLHEVDVGAVVKVKGSIGSFRDTKQVLLERLTIIRTTNEEATAWKENTVFRRDVLSKPWIVRDEDERRAKRKADGYEAKKKDNGKQLRKLKASKSDHQQRDRMQARRDAHMAQRQNGPHKEKKHVTQIRKDQRNS